MARFFIEDVKCGVTEGGFACGPVFGDVIAEAKIKSDTGEVSFFCLAEVTGIPVFMKTDRSTYDEQMQDNYSDEFIEYLDDHTLGEIDYTDVYTNPDMEYHDVLQYLSHIVLSGWEECIPFMESTKGKWLDEIEIPISEDEQDLLDELEEDAESIDE